MAVTRRWEARRSSSPAEGRSQTNSGMTYAAELLDLATDCVFVVDSGWRFTYLNERARTTVAEGRDLLGALLWAEFPALVGTTAEERYREAMATRCRARFEFCYRPHEIWYEVDISPLASGDLAVWFRDVDVAKQAEENLRRAEEKFRLAASASTDLVIEWDLETDQVVWREALQSNFGFGDGVIKSLDWCVDQVHPEDRERVSSAIRNCREGGERVTYECRIRKSDGRYAEVRQTAVAQRDADGKALCLILSVRDITEWKRANEAKRRRRTLLSKIFSQALVGILECGPDGRARLINRRYCEILGREENEIIGQDVVQFTHSEDIEQTRNLIRQKAAKGESFQVEKRYVRPNGEIVWCRLSASFMLTSSGEVESSVVVAEDISQQRQTTKRLEWASEHDPLTDLPNRRAFEARLHAASLRAMSSQTPIGLLLLDLDHFKHVNDSFGHDAGDSLLEEVGRRIKACIAPGDLVARLGGDEFAILVEESESVLNLSGLGETIRQEVRRSFCLGGPTVSVDASIGGAVFPKDAENANDLLKYADVALYARKGSGRGGTKLFHPAMLDQALAVASQLALARSAISEGSVDPHYQPKVELESGRIVGFEALLRWHHWAHGVQLPESVGEAFRDYELASKIGELVQWRTLSDLGRWLRQGLPVGCIAINAAPAEFMRDDFAEKLLNRLREFNIPSRFIEIEITEHVFSDRGPHYVGRALQTLKESGVRIALDDFGTGYSSLSHLRDFPVNVLKIDRTFVEKVTSDCDARSIVSALITLARSLRIDVVAEGIETERQRVVLQQEGCPFGQGYYFGRAIPAKQVPALLSGTQRALQSHHAR